MKQYYGVVVLLYVLLGNGFTFGQPPVPHTSSFQIMGKVKHEKTLTWNELAAYTVTRLSDVIITNHLGEKKGMATGLKGILLKNVLESLELDTDSPKKLSEFYFVCVASDGYKVVFSWNELFNTSTGNSTYIVIEKDGKTGASIPEGILLLSAADFKTGRRYLKGLAEIRVEQVK